MSGRLSSEEPSSRSSADFLSVNFDKFATSGLKSPEELRRHSIDQSLESKPVEKALHLFTVGDEIQRLSVVQSLLELYKQDAQGCAQRLVPKLQQNLSMASTEFHLATSAVIKSLMEKKIMPLDMFTQTFLHTIISGIDHRDPSLSMASILQWNINGVYRRIDELKCLLTSTAKVVALQEIHGYSLYRRDYSLGVVADAWVDCLVDVIPALPLSVLQKDVQGPAIQKGGSQKSVNSRVASSKIIGALCKKYPSIDVKRDLLPAVISLCQDVHAEVRTTMVQQLPLVVRPLGSETAKSMMLPILIDLAADEVPMVKEAAFAGVVDSIPFFTSDIIVQSILPLLKQLISYAFKYDNNVLLAVASSYGRMVTALERVIQQSDKDSYIKSYLFIADKCSAKSKLQGKTTKQGQGANRLVGDKAVKCRQYCAYNYPAMAKFVYNDGNRAPLESLHHVLADLLSDSYYLVRRSITVSFHELVAIYNRHKSLLRPEIIKALRDQEEEVLDGFIPHLGEILAFIIRHSFKDEEPQSLDIVKALIDCDAFLVTTANWRLYTTFLTQLEVLWYLLPVDSVYSNFVTLFFKRLSGCKALPVRMACLRTLLVTMKHTPKDVFRNETVARINDMASSSKFYDRLFYLQNCETMLDIFSTSFFKEHFFIKMIQMAEDPVANIRWTVCKLYPKFHAMVKAPPDKKLQVTLDTVNNIFEMDKDSEVAAMWKKSKDELESHNLVFSNDQSKYEDEKKMFSLNPKMIQTFPWSVAKMFEPTIMGVPTLQRRSTLEPRSESPSIPSASMPSKPSYSSRPDSASSRGRTSQGRGQYR